MGAAPPKGVPSGFSPHFRSSPLTTPWEPLYSRLHDDGVSLGLWVDLPHTNSRGFVHGGLLSALADNAMGLSCSLAIVHRPRMLTVSLSIDFLAAAAIGEWLEIRPSVVRTGSTLCFTRADIYANARQCAASHATYRVVH